MLDEYQNKINRVRFEVEEIRYRYKKTLQQYLKEKNQYHRRRRNVENVDEETIKQMKIDKIVWNNNGTKNDNRKGKKRIKRFRTISQMDTAELRESNSKVLDSTSIELDCEYCGLAFPSTALLVDHIRTRHDQKFQRDYLKGKFTDTDEREITKTEDPLKEIREGKINVNKMFDRRKRRKREAGKNGK